MEWKKKIKGDKTMFIKKGSAPPRYDEEFKKGAMALVTDKGSLSFHYPIDNYLIMW